MREVMKTKSQAMFTKEPIDWKWSKDLVKRTDWTKEDVLKIWQSYRDLNKSNKSPKIRWMNTWWYHNNFKTHFLKPFNHTKVIKVLSIQYRKGFFYKLLPTTQKNTISQKLIWLIHGKNYIIPVNFRQRFLPRLNLYLAVSPEIL
jgi:hypothetical protein